MPNAFVTFPQRLLELSRTHHLLTPNERLAREYKLAHADAQRQAGLKAWHTLRCTSLSRFLQAEYTRLADHNPQTPQLLSRQTLIGLSQLAAPADSSALLDVFLQAWQTVARFEIPLDRAEFRHARGQLFRRWHQGVVDRLAQNVVVEEQLGTLLSERSWQPTAPLLLIDFDVLTPSEDRYLRHVSRKQAVTAYTSLSGQFAEYAAGAFPEPEPRATPEVHQADDLRGEIAAAANWARQVKDTNPRATIGIVVPSLAQHHDLVQRQCAAIFDPLRGSTSPTFDIAAGSRLADQPVWQHGRRLLASTLAQFDAADLKLLAHSAFLDLSYARSLCANWPRRLRRTLIWSALRRWVEDPGYDALLEQLAAVPRRASMAIWMAHFSALLTAAGWPQLQRLGSVQYQALQAIQNIFTQYAADDDPQQISASAALQRLDLRLGQQLFAGERPHADIQVLGMLETTGLRFDALWVCGMDENSFPGRNLANPFVPRAAAAACGVPRSTQAQELEFASTLLRRWRSSCHADVIHFSFSTRGDDGEQRASPLLAPWSAQTHRLTPATHPWAVNQGIALERVVDQQAPSQARAGLGGGTGVLSAQAACPFKAFAQYRLRLSDPPVPGDFPDPMLRGNLLHDALFDLMRRYDSHAALCTVSDREVEDIAAAAVARLELPLAPDFVTHEVARLTNLLLEWLILEQARDPFAVVALEQAYELELGALSFRIRVDRIDSVNGVELVIDYKSGRANLRGLTDVPLADAQLPAYSLINDAIEGVYYAQVRDGEMRLAGAASDNAAISGARLLRLEGDWQAQRAAWRGELKRLARQFADGHAAVAPAPRACEYCHLRDLCRIDEAND